MGCPGFLQCSGLLLRRDFKSGKRQDQGAHADMGLRRRSREPAPAASDDWRLDVPSSSNPAKHCLQVIPQVDELRHRHFRVPVRSQPHDHFWKPSSLRVARRHAGGLPFSRPFWVAAVVMVVVDAFRRNGLYRHVAYDARAPIVDRDGHLSGYATQPCTTKALSAVSRASWCKASITLSPWLIVGGELHLFFCVGLLS